MIQKINICLTKEDVIDSMYESMHNSVKGCKEYVGGVMAQLVFTICNLIIVGVACWLTVTYGIAWVAFLIYNVVCLAQNVHRLHKSLPVYMSYVNSMSYVEEAKGYFDILRQCENYTMWDFLAVDKTPTEESLLRLMLPECKLLYLLRNHYITELEVVDGKLNVSYDNKTEVIDIIQKDVDPNAISVLRHGVFASKLEETPASAIEVIVSNADGILHKEEELPNDT